MHRGLYQGGDLKINSKIIMKQKITAKIFTAIVIPALILPLKCLGGTILPGDDPRVNVPDVRPRDIILGYIRALFFNFIINAFILAIAYLVIKRKDLIKSWKFLKYILFVTIGGFLINIIATFLDFYIMDRILTEMSRLRIFITLLFLGLLTYNYWLSRKFFNLVKKQAILIGVIMGIFSNLYLYLFIWNFSLFGTFIIKLLC